jgi:hypothetical protein
MTPGAPPVDGPWALADMCRDKEIVVFDDIGHLLHGLPERGLKGMRPTRAAALPLLRGEEVAGCLILCLNPALPYNGDFKRFLEVLSRQLSTAAAMVFSYEGEVQKSVAVYIVSKTWCSSRPNYRNEELAALDRAKTAFFTSESLHISQLFTSL